MDQELRPEFSGASASATEANCETAERVAHHLSSLFYTFKERGGCIPIGPNNLQLRPDEVDVAPWEPIPGSQQEAQIIKDADALLSWAHYGRTKRFENGMPVDFSDQLNKHVSLMKEALPGDEDFQQKVQTFRDDEESGIAAFYREIVIGSMVEQWLQNNFGPR